MIKSIIRYRTLSRCNSTSSINGILKDLNLIKKTPDVKLPHRTEVEMVYKELSHNVRDPQLFNRKLSNQLKLYNNEQNFQSLFTLLKKLDSLLWNSPSIEVYNQVFRSLLLNRSRSKAVNNALAELALKLVDDCKEAQLQLDETSFHYLDKIVASSDLLQIQLQYQQVLEEHDYFSVSYLIASGQYERCIDLFNDVWSRAQTDQSLKDLRIYKLVLMSLSRLDYKQVLKFLDILRASPSMIIEPHLWLKIVNDALQDWNYALVVYCYEHYLKPSNLDKFTESLSLKMVDVFALNGDTKRLTEVLEHLKYYHHLKIDLPLFGTIIESYCKEKGHVYAWKMLQNSIKSVEKLDQTHKHHFNVLTRHYPTLKSNKAISKIVQELNHLDLDSTCRDIIVHTLFKKVHDDTNLTGICILVHELAQSGLVDQVYKNYKTIIHSISRSTSAKLFTFNFFQLLTKNPDISLTSKDYLYLLRNSLFGKGVDNYNLTKLLVVSHLDTLGHLTDAQLDLLKDIKNDDSIRQFVQKYDRKTSPELYRDQLAYDLRAIVPSTDNYKNYNHKYDLINNEVLESLQRSQPL